MEEQKWYVLVTRPKWELKIYKALLGKGIEVCCPAYTSIRQWSDRKKKIKLPYFRGFVFVRLKESDRKLVFTVPGVVRYLFWQGKPAVVRDEEMAVMKEYLQEKGSANHILVERLAPGDKVTFKYGVLKDREAVVEEIEQNKILLVLPALGYRIRARMADLVQ